jgi:hypothetical protein
MRPTSLFHTLAKGTIMQQVQLLHRSTHLLIASRLIRFCALLLLVSSLVKLWHPTPVVEYMGSMGFAGSTYYVVAGVELLTAVLILVPSTRLIGVLLASAYFGGAVAAHLAIHRYTDGGAFLSFMATHPYIGMLEPGAILAALWLGIWLAQPHGSWNLSSLSSRLSAFGRSQHPA